MAQFDFSPEPDGPGYWLDCQTDLMEDFNTRFVVPLLPVDNAPQPVRQLNPVFEIGGAEFIMATHLASAIPASVIPPSSGSLADKRYEILNALDFLITGA